MHCRPHLWQFPQPGDEALVCPRCGRSLAFEILAKEPHRRMGVICAIRRRMGKERGGKWCAAFADAMNEYFFTASR